MAKEAESKTEELTITQKLRCIQTELKAPKSQYNNFGKYPYRNVEDIQEAIKPYLKKYECAFKFTDGIELIGERYYLKATAILKDDKGEETAVGYARESYEKKGMDDAQLTGSVSSYARKYAAGALLALDDTRDADSQNNTPPATTGKTTPKPSAPVDKISPDQLKMMYALMKEKGYTNSDEAKKILHNFGATESISSLSKSAATALIKRLKDAEKSTLDGFNK